jgi:cob(I)alamin adenosyltransferase
MSKLYTKKGDNGLTALYDMRLCNKEDLVFEVLGGLDELSAHIGLACAFLENKESSKILRLIQSKLLDIGSDVATVKNRKSVVEIKQNDVELLEMYIDEMDSKSPPLTEFILPGHSNVDAQLHVCRAVCRRVERIMWGWWKGQDNTDVQTVRYINRLSDFFFAMARLYSEGKEIRRSEAVKFEQ